MKFTLIMAAVLAMSTALAATPVGYQVFRDKASFAKATGELILQGFEAYPTEQCGGGGALQATSFTSPTFTVTTTATSGTSFLCIGTASQDSYDPRPTDGSNALIAGSNTGIPWSLTFKIAKPAYAVAFYLTDEAESGDAIFVGEDGQAVVISTCCRVVSDPTFFGVVAKKPFRSFQLKNTASSDGWGLDELMIGIDATRR
jgi:hypothetical protein